MYIKVINPVQDKLQVYDNSGSCVQVCNYVAQEKHNKNELPVFFSMDADRLLKEEAIKEIDKNVKGLKATEDKFVNIIISPSSQELEHIGDDKEKLQEYTRQVMGAYAENFNIKQPLSGDDLVWVASIHEDRHLKHNDIYFSEQDEKRKGVIKGAVKPGMENFKVGDKKPGLNTHIHVIVSCRDKEMKHTINPSGKKEKKFSITDFGSKAAILFDKQFDNKKTVTDYKRSINKIYAKKINFMVNHLNNKHDLCFDKKFISEIMKGTDNNKNVYEGLQKLRYEINTPKNTEKEIPIDCYEFIKKETEKAELNDLLKEYTVKEEKILKSDPEKHFDLSFLKDFEKSQQNYENYIPDITKKKRKRKKGRKL